MEEITTQDIAREKKKREKKKRRRKIILWIILILLVLAIGVGGYMYSCYLEMQEVVETFMTYTAVAVQTGEIKTTMSGSGTLSPLRSDSYTAPGNETTVEELFYRTGEIIPAGGVIMTLSCEDSDTQKDSLETELADIREQLSKAERERSHTVTATAEGVIKHVAAKEGDLAEDMDYLCLISTDETMKVTISLPEGLKKYDTVLCRMGDGTEANGLVFDMNEDSGLAVILIKDDDYLWGSPVTVLTEDGKPLGSGMLDVNECIEVTIPSGRILFVSTFENQKVSPGRRLFTLVDGAPTNTYYTLKEQEKELLEQINEISEDLIVVAEYDCMLTELPVKQGDTLTAGDTLCSVAGTDGYSMSLNIDELDISSIAHGQKATITLDALEGSWSAEMVNITYAGSGSYVTSYTAILETEPIPGAYPGMSATAEIITSSSGESAILPVGAIRYEGRGPEQKAYVLLAGAGVNAGDTVPEADMNESALEKVYVTTGMSDGGYIAVTGDLKAGDMIFMSDLKTNAVYQSDGSSSGFDFGSMGGFSMGGSMGRFDGSMGGGSGRGSMGGGGFGGGMPSPRG